MAAWGELARASSDLAAAGRALLDRTGSGEGLLATVRDGGSALHAYPNAGVPHSRDDWPPRHPTWRPAG
jgi:hypothetical protein